MSFDPNSSTRPQVNGFNTLFKDEIALGDLLRILHPGTLLPESRAVTQIMGNRSLMLVAPFSANFSSTTEYQIERVSELIKAKAEAKAGKQAGGGEDGGEDEDAFDNHMKEQLEKTLKKQRQTVQIREKVYGGPGVTYKTVTKEVGKDMTAEERLNMREKEGRDKYCW